MCIDMEKEEEETKTVWRQVRLPILLIKKLKDKRIWKHEPYYSVIDRIVGGDPI